MHFACQLVSLRDAHSLVMLEINVRKVKTCFQFHKYKLGYLGCQMLQKGCCKKKLWAIHAFKEFGS